VTEKDPNADIVRETLQSHGFPHLNAFLGAIAAKSGRELFDDEVVLSYWFGGDLTEETADGSGKILISKYEKQLPKDAVKVLSERLPDIIFLTHLSQVALVAAAEYEPKEKATVINLCMIAYGKILSVDLDKKVAKVKRDMLRSTESGGYEVFIGKQYVNIDPDLTGNLNVGDEVAVHLGYLAAKIEGSQIEKLRYWTKKVTESL
jgi:hypothetical protein